MVLDRTYFRSSTNPNPTPPGSSGTGLFLSSELQQRQPSIVMLHMCNESKSSAAIWAITCKVTADYQLKVIFWWQKNLKAKKISSYFLHRFMNWNSGLKKHFYKELVYWSLHYPVPTIKSFTEYPLFSWNWLYTLPRVDDLLMFWS